MGAPTSVTRYVKTQSSAKNSTQQKWLHEALPSHPHPIGILGLMRILTMSELSLNYRNISILIEWTLRFKLLKVKMNQQQSL